MAEVVAAYPTLNHRYLGTPQEQVQLIGNLTTPLPTDPDAITSSSSTSATPGRTRRGSN